MLEPLREEITRRRALLITPFAFAGLVAVSSWKRDDDRAPDAPAGRGSSPQVAIVEFTDRGAKLGLGRVPKIVHSPAEWRKLLTAEQYWVTRQQGTDTAFSGSYYQLHKPGLYRCLCCGDALFSSDAKFDSGTGWPSFWAPLAEENVYTSKDVNLFVERVEVLCRRCDAHLGHVFNDGPEPTYLRYCINESALRFVPRPA